MANDNQSLNREEEIRNNWAAALEAVKEGEDLSMDTGWSFNDEDIKELARLHRENKYREKIECLLVDCNFISEAMDFSTGKYEAYGNTCSLQE